MASSKASHVYFGDGSSLERLEMHTPKQTAIDKIGGIFCHICNSIVGNKRDFDNHYSQHNIGGSEIVYTCVACKKQISNYPSFRGHCYLNHVVKNKFQCKHCSKSFCKLSILNSHISSVHDYKCSSCDDKFPSKKELETHKKITHTKMKKGRDAPPYECLFCSTIIETVDVCKSHIDEHCEMRYPCPICKELMPNKLAAVKHLTNHFDEKIPTDISPSTPSIGEDSSIDVLGGILCCHCNSLFRNRAEIDTHFSVEHEDKTIVYSCNICSKQYEKYDLFGDHCYYHYSRGRFQCDQCYKPFPRLSLLVLHTEAFHFGCTAEKPYMCEPCGHGFMTSLRLQEHMRIVHEDSDIKTRCMKPGCTATFDKPRDLVQHLKNHSPDLDNWCRDCGLQFASLSSAEKHLDVHRRKQYSCPICSREYREKYLMVKHVPVHFESVMHVCKMCGKVYAARYRLMEHLKTHSDPSYKCTYCSKGFIKPYELQQHLNIHTGRKPFSCTLCPKTFANYPNWSKHLNRIHDLDKTVIKRLKAEQETESIAEKSITIKTSPKKAESGIESAGSEMSVDLYSFMESDDSINDVKEFQTWNTRTAKNVKEINNISNPVSGEVMSISDTVNAVIDRIDSLDDDLDVMASKMEMNKCNDKYQTKADFNNENITHDIIDDASDIQAIVEHIDAMSGEMDSASNVDATISNVPGLDVAPEVFQYANMMPMVNANLQSVSDTAHTSLPEVSYYQNTDCLPEYGPDFINQGAGLSCDDFINLDDHNLPHINPLLTIEADDNAKKYVQNLDNFNFENVTAPMNYETQNWVPPIITKVYHTIPYEENNDANRMYIY